MYKTANENMTYKIIIEFSKTIEMFGLTPLEAQLFVYLYLQKEPKTLDDMSSALGKSKTSMSTGIRSLSDVYLVSRVWKKGVRKDLYEANSQLFKSFMTNYVNKWIDASDHQKDSLIEIQKEIEQDNSQSFLELTDTLNKIIEFHNDIENVFRQLKSE